MFLKILIDSFGPNKCGKYGLKSFGILGFSPHTLLSLLYIESAMRADYIFQAMLKNIINSHCAFIIKETQVCVQAKT